MDFTPFSLSHCAQTGRQDLLGTELVQPRRVVPQDTYHPLLIDPKCLSPNPHWAKLPFVALTLRLRASDTVADELMISNIASLRVNKAPGLSELALTQTDLKMNRSGFPRRE